MQSDKDIIITGSGLIGLSTALLLEKNKIRSTIIDKNPFNTLKINNDKRTTAISLGSSQIFKKIGIWQMLQKYSQPIYKIKVTEGVKEKEEGVLEMQRRTLAHEHALRLKLESESELDSKTIKR